MRPNFFYCCLFLLIPTLAAAMPRAFPYCFPLFKNLTVNHKVIDLRANKAPVLTQYLKGINKDPNLLPRFKRLFHEAMSNEELSVQAMTQAVRDEWAGEEGVGAYSYGGPRIMKDGVHHYLFASKAERGPFLEDQAREPVIAIQLFPERDGFSHEELIFHEMAHIRFLDFLDRRFQQLAARGAFPGWAVTKVDGQYYMHDALYTYLAERYAYDAQLAALRYVATRPGMEKVIPSYQRAGWLALDEKAARAEIIKTVRKHCPEARDPRLEELDKLSLHEIFLKQGPTD